MTSKSDYLTKEGAAILARQIRDYWLRRGIRIDTWTEAVPTTQGLGVWGVRSSLNISAVRDPDPKR